MKNLDIISKWLSLKKWKLLPFQKEAWDQYFERKSGLICVPTGAGKTYAAYLPALEKLHHSPQKGTQILYISPLKALAKDLEYALKQPIEDLQLPYRVERRTGDTSFSIKKKQKLLPPEILLTTPESLALMLTDEDAASRFQYVQTFIVDEWHELLGSKRGVLLELCLARLKRWNPELQIWGLTATIGNLEEAAQVCVGMDRIPTVVTATMDREVIVTSILPKILEGMPWAGYLGIKMLPFVLEHLSEESPTLIFTNTRSQAERWYHAIKEAKSQWENIVAVHHSSIDKKIRTAIEEGIKTGNLKFVICTSSLDLGVDLPTVEKVIQIGSPKSIARLIQRAGRSSHQPLTPCHIALVPTYVLEAIELKGYRMALKEHLIEERAPLKNCYDVLLQHLTTCAIGGGFSKEDMYNEVKTTACFADHTESEFEACLDFLMTGGKSLRAYAEYKKLEYQKGIYFIKDPNLIRRHKMHIGTIASDAYVNLKLLNGKSLGLIEEAFITQLKEGETFLFAGKKLKLSRYHEMTAHVRLSHDTKAQAAVWKGSRLPFSAQLGYILRKSLDAVDPNFPESSLVRQIFEVQTKVSHIPKDNEFLVELLKSREGWHLFAYPFEGKTLHEGIAMLIAHRLSKNIQATYTLSCNDYGFEILANKPFEESYLQSTLKIPEQEELEEMINLHEAGKACFRDIARIAGLVFQGYPGRHKSHRQLQMTSGLLYDVFKKYDPDHLLLKQARQEVLDTQFEKGRFYKVLHRLSQSVLIVKNISKHSPFSLPLFVERVSERLSTETLEERIKNIQKSWTKL